MKVTICRDNGKIRTLRTLPLISVIQKLQTETKSRPVSALRAELRTLFPGNRPEKARQIPVMIFAAAFRRHEERIIMTAFNGIVLLEVNNLAGRHEIEEIKQMAASIPQTLAAFTGAGGRSVKILVRFSRPDGSLPMTPESARIYLAHAYIKAIRIYAPQITYPIEFKEPLPERGCRFSYDPAPYFFPEAHPVIMEQPEEMPEQIDIPEVKLQEPNPVRRMIPGYDRFQAASLLYETSLRQTLEQSGQLLKEKKIKDFLVALARNCFRSGVPEEDMIHWTITRFDLHDRKEEVRQTVSICYGLEDGFGEKLCINTGQLTAMKMNEFLERRYQFRYNAQTMEVEYRRNLSAVFRFSPVDIRVLNTIVLEAQEEGLQVWDRDIKRYIHSEKIPVYHPVDTYLKELPVWDGHDRIRQLAHRLPCRNTFWPDFFHRWFLAMVAQWQGKIKGYGNSVAPLLIGGQGIGKSTFCKQILPPELRNLYNDRIDFSHKRDAELYLNRFALINIDEFDQISEKDQAFLKHILQKPEIITRKPYQSSMQILKRNASFIATSNHKDLLTDLSGSRRFICIEVTDKVDTMDYIDYPQLYAQVVKEIRQGERLYFTPEEQVLLNESNEEFRIVPPLEQLFINYYRIPQEGEEGQWLLAIQLFETIKKRSGIRLSDTKINYFGRILNKQKVPSRRPKEEPCIGYRNYKKRVINKRQGDKWVINRIYLSPIYFVYN